MNEDIWRGQIRAPGEVMEWVRLQAKDRFTSMNSVIVEALREYRERHAEKQEKQQ